MLQEAQWSDIDYMKSYLDWTYDKDGAYPDLANIVNDLHNHSQKYVIIVVSCMIRRAILRSYDIFIGHLLKSLWRTSIDRVLIYKQPWDAFSCS